MASTSSWPPRTPSRCAPSRSQQGAAALIVVMLLFFVMSLVAAYTSRNLIFDQRTTTNQYRSTQAFEAAEAGIEWALGQLNAGRIGGTCQGSTTATDASFQQRYLSIDTGSGAITPVVATTGSVNPTCVLNTTNANAANWTWDCRCPQAATTGTTLTAPASAFAPAFVLEFASAGARPDLVHLRSYSCTRLASGCMDFTLADRGATGDGVAAVQITVALRGAITRLPAAPLTVMGASFTIASGATVTARNTDAASNGVTVHAAGTTLPASGLSLSGLPGVAGPRTSVSGDSSLAPADVSTFTQPDRKFVHFFGVTPGTYLRQPGLPQLDCSSGCNASAINTALSRNPGRPVWLTGAGGSVTLDADIGTAAPALLIVDGDVVVSSSITFNGVIYGRKAAWAWSVSGSPTFNGAVIAEGNLAVSGTGSSLSLNYDAAKLRELRVSQGMFVRVPGSWKDF